MKISVSQIRTHLECPQKAYNEHVLRRIPITSRTPSLEIGTCWHLAMQGYLEAREHDAAKAIGAERAADYLNSLKNHPNYMKVLSTWLAIFPAYQVWDWPDEWELLAVEKLVSHNFSHLPDVELVGRLDGLVKWAGQYWHLQHKTLSPSTPLSVYYAYMQRDWHECWYEFACRKAGYTPYGGTILNVVRKLSARTIADRPRMALSVQYIPRSEAIVKKAMWDIETLAGDIATSSLRQHLQNRSMCAGRFGNSPCPYLDVCNEVALIEDNSRFQTIEDRYAAPEIPLEDLL